MVTRRLIQSLGFLLTLAAFVAIPGVARAVCGSGKLVVSGQLPVPEVVFLSGSAAVVNGIDVNYEAVEGGGNCMVNTHMNIPAVGTGGHNLSPPLGDGAPPSFPQGFVFEEFYEVEIGAALLIGGPSPLRHKVALGVTLSSLASVPSFPQVGTLDFAYSTAEGCDISSWSAFSASGCFALLTRIPVYVEDVAVISMIPVLFN